MNVEVEWVFEAVLVILLEVIVVSLEIQWNPEVIKWIFRELLGICWSMLCAVRTFLGLLQTPEGKVLDRTMTKTPNDENQRIVFWRNGFHP